MDFSACVEKAEMATLLAEARWRASLSGLTVVALSEDHKPGDAGER